MRNLYNGREKGRKKVQNIIDTNIFISSVLFKGKADKLVKLWKKREFVFLISKDVLEEYIQVLSYPKFSLTKEEIKYIIEEELLPFVKIIKVSSCIEIIKDDISDNKFISLAIDGKADFIVSGDKHLLELNKVNEIKIISLKKFLSLIKK